MPNTQIDFQALCLALLRAESEEEVTSLLQRYGLIDPKHWKPLGNMPNNRSMVNNQQQDPAGAKVEILINAIDAMLTRACLQRGIPTDSADAPKSMTEAAERFFEVRDGNLANLDGKQIGQLAENIQLVVTGTKHAPCYLTIDKGEGQTPNRFEDTFLSLIKSNKAR
jgi:hypothetical protein